MEGGGGRVRVGRNGGHGGVRVGIDDNISLLKCYCTEHLVILSPR